MAPLSSGIIPTFNFNESYPIQTFLYLSTPGRLAQGQCPKQHNVSSLFCQLPSVFFFQIKNLLSLSNFPGTHTILMVTYLSSMPPMQFMSHFYSVLFTLRHMWISCLILMYLWGQSKSKHLTLILLVLLTRFTPWLESHGIHGFRPT